MDSTGLELRYLLELSGERAGCMRKDVLEKFPLPEPLDVNFVFEGSMWNKIDLNYKTRFINEIYKYYTVSGDDSITNGIKNRSNSKYFISKYYYYRDQLNTIPQFLYVNKWVFITRIVGLLVNGFFGKKKYGLIISEIENKYIQLLAILLTPIALIIVLKRKFEMR